MLNRNSGQIVAISSLISLVGTHSLSAYTASKWGVTGELFFIYLGIIINFTIQISLFFYVDNIVLKKN